MLSKKKRLDRNAFNHFFSIGKRLHTPTFQLIYTPHKEFHASVVVSKKIEKTAVGRNKLRRHIYNILRTEGPPQGGVFLVIAKKNNSNFDTKELQKKIKALVGRTVDSR